MRYRRLGDSGTKTSAIALGGWTTFGETITDQNVVNSVVQTAYESGIIFFDMADMYAYGKSETMMGTALREFPRHTLVLSSKIFWPMSDDINDRGLSRKHIMESIDKSLKRIGTDYLDIYFCHRYDPETPVEEVVRAMDDLIHRGKILYWGTSKWPGAKISDAVGIAREANLYVPRVEQPGYSLMRRLPVEDEILPVATDHGIGLTPYSPLENGILTGKYDDGVPQGSRASHNEKLKERLTERTVDGVRKLKPIADELNITRAQLALAWILRHPEISSVITGATKPEHIKANAGAADIDLTDEVIAQIDDIFPAG